jgi:hypothetical protein
MSEITIDFTKGEWECLRAGAAAAGCGLPELMDRAFALQLRALNVDLTEWQDFQTTPGGACEGAPVEAAQVQHHGTSHKTKEGYSLALCSDEVIGCVQLSNDQGGAIIKSVIQSKIPIADWLEHAMQHYCELWSRLASGPINQQGRTLMELRLRDILDRQLQSLTRDLAFLVFSVRAVFSRSDEIAELENGFVSAAQRLTDALTEIQDEIQTVLKSTFGQRT